jgi:plastocyanin
MALSVVCLIAVAAAAYYLQSSGASRTAANTTEVDVEIVGGVGPGTVDTYSPDSFEVRQGQQVTLVVLNTDDNTHGLVIDQFKVDTGIMLGGHAARATFLANQSGTFKFYEPPGYCTGGVTHSCNSEQRMVGSMTVTPSP